MNFFSVTLCDPSKSFVTWTWMNFFIIWSSDFLLFSRISCSRSKGDNMRQRQRKIGEIFELCEICDWVWGYFECVGRPQEGWSSEETKWNPNPKVILMKGDTILDQSTTQRIEHIMITVPLNLSYSVSSMDELIISKFGWSAPPPSIKLHQP